MHKEDAKISCQVFQKQEAVIKDITNKINAIEGVTGKAVFAEELRKEVDVLLSCQDYKDTSLNCKSEKTRITKILQRLQSFYSSDCLTPLQYQICTQI